MSREGLRDVLFKALCGKRPEEVITSWRNLQNVTGRIVDLSGDKFTVFQKLLGLSRVQLWRKLSDPKLFNDEEIRKVLKFLELTDK